MFYLARWVKDDLHFFLKLLIPNVKLLKNGIDDQRGHGEGNVRARINQPKTNQVPITKVEQGEINQKQIKFQLQKENNKIRYIYQRQIRFQLQK
jgi:hypothetical protein